MENIDSKDYGYFERIWIAPERYALVKDELRDGFSIIDVIDKLYVLIEDEQMEKLVQDKLRENECSIINNIRDVLS